MNPNRAKNPEHQFEPDRVLYQHIPTEVLFKGEWDYPGRKPYKFFLDDPMIMKLARIEKELNGWSPAICSQFLI